MIEVDGDEEEQIDVEAAPDRIFIMNKLRILFKNTKDEGILNVVINIISLPLNILRDYSVPCGEEAQWDKQKASVIPMTLVFSFFVLNGNIGGGSAD